MNAEPVLESLAIAIKTDFFLTDLSAQPYECRGSSMLLGLEMFVTQTQPDLHLFLYHSPRRSLGSNLKHSSSSMSTDSSDTATQVQGVSASRHTPALSWTVQRPRPWVLASKSLSFTSNETLKAMVKFLLANLTQEHDGVSVQLCRNPTVSWAVTVSNFWRWSPRWDGIYHFLVGLEQREQGSLLCQMCVMLSVVLLLRSSMILCLLYLQTWNLCVNVSVR
jgi:hypothetical protein